MNTILIYLLKVNIAIALFYIFYRMFFARDTFWKTRRLYLIASIIVSFIYPFLSIENWLQSQKPIQTIVTTYHALPEYTVNAQQTASNFNWLELALYVYLVVVAVLVIRLFVQLISILKIKLKSEKSILRGVEVNIVAKNITPFSFFNEIYLNPSIHQSHELEQILTHELTHVRQRHSVDVLLSELLCCVFWINPFVWLVKKEIRQNLEFLADNFVIESGYDTKSYQYNLLQLSFQNRELILTNKFNVLPLKKRIKMMNQQKSSKTGLLKYLLVIPLATALVITSNAETLINKAQNKLAENNPKVNPVTKPANELDEVKVVGYGETQKTENNELAVQAHNDAAPEASPETQLKPQKPVNEIVIDDRNMNTAPDKNKVFMVVEKMPVYPGGDVAMFIYLGQNVRYPVEAQKNGIQGRVICQFVIDFTGAIDSVKVVRSVDPLLDAEAIRVIKGMPNWTPGEQRGEKVRVKYTLPINFNLQGGTKTTNKQISMSDPKNPPLIVLDGEIMPANFNMNNLKPENIDKIEVLKDASATAAYGDKGKNGVIVVRTKK